MSRFSCICLNHCGSLCANEEGCYFTSALMKVTFLWGQLKCIRLETKQIKGVPTSVLLIKLEKACPPVHLQAFDTDILGKQRGPTATRRYYFYGFQDLLLAEDRLKAMWEKWKRGEFITGGANLRTTQSDNLCVTTTTEKSGTVDRQVTEGGADRMLLSSSSHALDTSETIGLNLVPPAVKSDSVPTHRRRLQLSAKEPLPKPQLSTISFFTKAEKYVIALYDEVLPIIRFFMHSPTARILTMYMLVALACIWIYSSVFRSGGASVDHATGHTPLHATQKVLEKLDAVQRFQRDHHSYSSLSDHLQHNLQERASTQDASLWVRDMRAATKELVQSYVLLQTQITSLRARRIERLQSAPLSSDERTWQLVSRKKRHSLFMFGEGEDRESAANSYPRVHSHRQKEAKAHDHSRSHRTRRFSLSRVYDDVFCWLSWLQSLFSFFDSMMRHSIGTSPLFGHFKPRAEPHTTMLRYAEPFLHGYDLLEYISLAESHERMECKRLSEQLVQVSRLLEHVFIEFYNALLKDTYERYASGTERASFWSHQPSSAGSVHAHSSHFFSTTFDGEEILQLLLLRRYATLVLYMNPLEIDDARRRLESLNFTKLLTAFHAQETILTRDRNDTSRDKLLQAFEDTVLQRIFANAKWDSATVSLRNPLAELRFWSSHEELWMEHVFASLPLPQQKQLLDRVNGVRRKLTSGSYNATHNTTLFDRIDWKSLQQPSMLKWKNLPIFRGLLCFSPQPHLVRVLRNWTDGGEKEVEMKRQEDADASAAVLGQNEPLDAHDELFFDATVVSAAQTHSLGIPVNEQNESNASHRATLRTGPSTNGVRGVGVTETERGQPHPVPCSDYSLQSCSHGAASASGSANNSRFSFRLLITELREQKVRWLSELDVFLHTLGEVSPLSHHRRSPLRSYHLADDQYVDRSVIAARETLFSVLQRIHVWYTVPYSIARRCFGLVYCLWPFHWPCCLRYSSQERLDLSFLQDIGSADPAVQSALVQVVGVPWGTTTDVPHMLLSSKLLQPRDLIQLKAKLWQQLLFEWMLFLIGVSILGMWYVTS